MQAENQRQSVRVRSEGADVVLTLDAQQSRDLARAIEHSTASSEWLDEAATTLSAMADQLQPARPAGMRRPLRTPGYPSASKPPRPRASRSDAPRAVAPTPRAATTTAPATYVSAESVTTAPAPAPAPVAPGSGLAAAVATFADAITVGQESRPPSVPPSVRRATSAQARAKELQEILEAARTSAPVHAQV